MADKVKYVADLYPGGELATSAVEVRDRFAIPRRSGKGSISFNAMGDAFETIDWTALRDNGTESQRRMCDVIKSAVEASGNDLRDAFGLARTDHRRDFERSRLRAELYFDSRRSKFSLSWEGEISNDAGEEIEIREFGIAPIDRADCRERGKEFAQFLRDNPDERRPTREQRTQICRGCGRPFLLCCGDAITKPNPELDDAVCLDCL